MRKTTVEFAIARAERLLPGSAAPKGRMDPRWQAILAVAARGSRRPRRLSGVSQRGARWVLRRLGRRVDDAPFVTEFGREEAQYLRAVALLDRGHRRDVAAAVVLLQRANRDDDYPEADAVLAQVNAGRKVAPCRCRRHRHRHTLGQAQCELHSARGRHPVKR